MCHSIEMQKAIRRVAAALQLRPQEEGEEFSAAVARVANKHGVSPLSLKQSGGCLTRTERKSGGERACWETREMREGGWPRLAEHLLHESGLNLAGVVGRAGRCGGAVGRVRAVTAWGTGFKAERNNGVTAQACRAAICSGARHSGSGASRVQRA